MMRSLFLILLLVSPGWSAISLLQKATGALVDGTSAASGTLGSTPIAGNLLIGIIGSNDGSCTNPVGYTTAVSQVNTTDDDLIRIVYKIAGAGEATSITFTDLAGNNHTVAFMEYQGNTASPLDVIASVDVSAGVTSRTSGTTGSTAQADELSIAVWRVRANVSAITYSNSFVEQYDMLNPANGETMVADKIETTVGTKECTASWTTAGNAWGAIATFKATVATGGASRGLIIQ